MRTRDSLIASYNLIPEEVDKAIQAMKHNWAFTEEAAIDVIAAANDRYGAAMPLFIKVRDKQNNLISMVPTTLHLKFKKHQRHISFVVKPRQVYFTTFMGADYYLDCIMGKGVKALFINLDNRVTEEVFDRVKTADEQFTLKPLLPKKKRSTTRKLTWANGASYDAITAKNEDGEDSAKQLGRSCTVQRVHVSECGSMKWYRAFQAGLMDSKPIDGYVVFEGTGNGAQGGWYEDCMEIQEHGKQAAPNVWVLGDKSLHFFGWWEHPEYRLSKDPLPEFKDQMTTDQAQKLEQSEQEHINEMRKDTELPEDQIQLCINWRRWRLFNEKGFLRDPDGALLNMDREYPAKIRHAFATTGSAFLSLMVTDQRREEWKSYNKANQLPLYGRLVPTDGSNYTIVPGNELMFWAFPHDNIKEPWSDRYLVSADVGGGNSDSDPDCIRVKDRHLNMYVATAHGRWGPIKTAELLMALGYYYHTAKIVWEVNNHGVATSVKIWESQYPNIFMHDEKAESYHGMGFLTGERSRANALKVYKVAYENATKPLLDPFVENYKEVAAFGPPPGKPNGKLQGQGGVHDDIVMSTAIAEAVDAMMPEPTRTEMHFEHAPGTIGSMIHGHSNRGGLKSVF